MSQVLHDPSTKASEVTQQPEPPVRVVEVPDRFLNRLAAVAGATLHPSSTTIIRVISSHNTISASISAVAETGGGSDQSSKWL
jgi:hypothetical protein